jgi:GNAT superfamily N-acetyltransferase
LKTAGPELIVKPVTGATWPDLEALFEGRGGPKYCWCMAWREMENRASADAAARKAALHQRVREGIPIGILGYVGGEPVAWCSVAPRETFTKLGGATQDHDTGVWSIVCFFVRRDHRRSGLSGRLLEEAVKLARKHGATKVEGYPVDPESPSYRFMGFVSLFQEHGFDETGRAGSRRHVMRRQL